MTTHRAGLSTFAVLLLFTVWGTGVLKADDEQDNDTPLSGASMVEGEGRADPIGNDGAYKTALPIELPPFRGNEPMLTLTYSSDAGNGILGLGWTLGGLSFIERYSRDGGIPTYSSSDVYYLGGQELIPCSDPRTRKVGGVPVPASCRAGGTHYTKVESYLRIQHTFGPEQWIVTAKNGTKTIYGGIFEISPGVWKRWGIVRTETPVPGNVVEYNWDSLCGSSVEIAARQLRSIVYNGTVVYFHYDTSLRPDYIKRATGTSKFEAVCTRLRLIDIYVRDPASPNPKQYTFGRADSNRVRVYQLSYAKTSGAEYPSRLTLVQVFGKDAVLDWSSVAGGNFVRSGTSLPANLYVYQGEAPSGSSFGSPVVNDTEDPAVITGDYFVVDYNNDGYADQCKSKHYGYRWILNFSRVTGNTAAGPGGGILNVNSLTLNSTVVRGNVPDDCAC